MRSPVAMISYSWKSEEEKEAAELLHDELALRGFDVIHDRHTFMDGSRIPANMEGGVDQCDVFVAYLTPNSLYLKTRPDAPRPALTQELIPALERRRRSLGSGRRERPILILLAHGLGDRREASDTLRKLTGERVESLWSKWLDQSTDRITQPEAAEAAARALQASVVAEPFEPPVDLCVATRGTAPPTLWFTIDGTRLLGGERKPGDPADWVRFLAALQSVSRHLGRACGGGEIRIDLKCHLSAAVATGRVFHQATGWTPRFATKYGDMPPGERGNLNGIAGALDRYAATGDLLVDIAVLDHDVAGPASEVAKTLGSVAGRLSLIRTESGDLPPQKIAQLARGVSERIRSAHSLLRPARIHLMMSAPAAFAGLLGHHLTALEAAMVLYEMGPAGYVRSVVLPATMP